MEKNYANLSICGDCLMFLANGEAPLTDPETGKDWTQEQEQAWINSLIPGHVTLGLMAEHHDDDCPNFIDGEWDGAYDEPCEQLGFSMSSCDNCKSTLGGDRYAATLHLNEVSQ